jgi:hypothetical protein
MDPVEQDRAADRTTKLIAPEVGNRRPGGIVVLLRVAIDSVERLVAEELEPLPVELIAAALGDDVDDATDAAAVFCRRLADDDLEFLDRRLRDVFARVARSGNHVVHPVDDVVGAGGRQAAESDRRSGSLGTRRVCAGAWQQQ